MKVTLTGWRRQVFPHNHQVTEVHAPVWKSQRVKSAERYVSEKVALLVGKISNVRLTGDFRLDLILSEAEVGAIVKARIDDDPVACVEWLGKLQAEAIGAALKATPAVRAKDSQSPRGAVRP